MILLETGNYRAARVVQPSVPSHNDRWGTRDGNRQPNPQRQETAAGTHGRAIPPRFTESGERPRIDRSHPLIADYESHSSAPPTVPDALLLLDEAAPPVFDSEPPPESRRTTLGPFRYLKDAADPREFEAATQRRLLSESDLLELDPTTQRR